KQDIATGNFTSDNVSVLLGDGAGAFSMASSFAAGDGPITVVVGDFNGDGKQDLAVANQNSSNVSVLLGDGAGSFSAATNFAVGSHPYSIAVGDFNGDGKQDLAVANMSSSDVSVLLGDGAGSFSDTANFSVGNSPFWVAVGDFNGDGQPDLATANFSSNNVSVLLRQCPAANTIAVTNTNDSGAGSLRQAIIDFNNTAGLQTITFNIAGAGVHTIALASALPIITDPIIIDGTTQPGYAGAPLIELDGTGAGAGAHGLNITAGNSTVRALVINRFNGNGININTAGNNLITGCYIGTNAAGTAGLNNNQNGIQIRGNGSNTIGGTTAAARNV